MLTLPWAPRIYVVGSLSALKRWFLFKGISGDKRIGLQQLEIAAARGRYLRSFAKILLALAALHEKKPDVARAQLMELVSGVPAKSALTGQELREIISRTPNEIELRNQHGRCCRILSSDEALALDPNLFVGIGNRRRIRFLRSRTLNFTLNSGSRTTRRLKNEAGLNISHPSIRDHRPVYFKR